MLGLPKEDGRVDGVGSNVGYVVGVNDGVDVRCQSRSPSLATALVAGKRLTKGYPRYTFVRV